MLDLYKDVMGNYPTGVTIVTAMENDEPIGITVNSFASVSLSPLLVLWSIDKSSRSLNAFLNTGKFAVNILSESQEETCFLFSKSSISNEERFGHAEWQLSDRNLPVLNSSYATLECETYQQIEAGDHYILLGKVVNVEKRDTKPILYYNRNVQPVIEHHHT